MSQGIQGVHHPKWKYCDFVKYSVHISRGPWPNKLVTKIHTKLIVLLLRTEFVSCFSCIVIVIDSHSDISNVYLIVLSKAIHIQDKHCRDRYDYDYARKIRYKTPPLVFLPCCQQLNWAKGTSLATAKKARDSMRMLKW